MATVPTKLMTADEFWDFVHRPENQGMEYDLVRGEIEALSRPGKVHGVVCAAVVFLLSLYARQRKKGYICGNDTGVIVERDPDTVRGPDIMYFEDAETIDQIDLKWGEAPPRLAVEVLSPNDTTGKVNRKIRDQLRFGTPLVWLVDPAARNVTVYRPGREYQVLEAEEELTGEDVLPGFQCRVAEFFKLPGE